jgi:putative DNA primase/helicase
MGNNELSPEETKEAEQWRVEKIKENGIFSQEIKRIANEIQNLEERAKKQLHRQQFYENEIFIPKRLVDWLLKKFHFITLKDTEETFLYIDGIYKPYGDRFIETLTLELLDDETKVNKLSEVLKLVKVSTYKDREEIEECDKHLIFLENGIFNLQTLELDAFNPKHVSFGKLPIIYDKEKDCTRFKQFLTEILLEEDIPIIQEMFGFCLWKDYFIQKAFMLVGEGANGKSVLLGTLLALLGKDNISNCSLQDIIKNRFSCAKLYGKMANINSELPSKTLWDTDRFKSLTGKDMVFADLKYRGGFSFINYAKLIFACNQLPQINEDSYAYFRRWIIINFPNRFDDNKADKTLLQKLTTQNELSGIFNWALEGLKRLLEKQQFSYSKSTEETAEIYIKQSDSLRAFVIDHIIDGVEFELSKEEFYEKYVEYCDLNDFEPRPKNVVTMRLNQLCRVKEVRKHEGKRFWAGIKFITDKKLQDITDKKLQDNGYELSPFSNFRETQGDTSPQNYFFEHNFKIDNIEKQFTYTLSPSVSLTEIKHKLIKLIKDKKELFTYLEIEQDFTKDLGREPSQEEYLDLYKIFQAMKTEGLLLEPRHELYKYIG